MNGLILKRKIVQIGGILLALYCSGLFGQPVFLTNNTKNKLLVQVTTKKTEVDIEDPRPIINVFSFVLFPGEQFFKIAQSRDKILGIKYRTYGQYLGVFGWKYTISLADLISNIIDKKLETPVDQDTIRGIDIKISSTYTKYEQTIDVVQIMKEHFCQEHMGMHAAKKLEKDPTLWNILVRYEGKLKKTQTGPENIYLTLSSKNKELVTRWARFVLLLPEKYDDPSRSMMFNKLMDRYKACKDRKARENILNKAYWVLLEKGLPEAVKRVKEALTRLKQAAETTEQL